jgi:ribosomal protein S18 acetylase RimI-like enzyme
MISFRKKLEGTTPDQLEGFFSGWPNPPTTETFIKLLKNSDEFILAFDEDDEKVVGFITAITDHVLAAYIPFLEVLQDYQGQDIGKQLVELMIEHFKELYMIDLLCDEHLQGFYQKLGMHKASGMMVRNYEHQSGE